MRLWIAWIGILAIASLLFFLLRQLLKSIEEDEEAEAYWDNYIAELWQTDPDQAQYYLAIREGKLKVNQQQVNPPQWGGR